MTPKRIQLRRTKGWRKPEDAIVVARPTEWGNPWRVGDRIMLEWPLDADVRTGRELVVTPELAVALYRVAFEPDAHDIRAELGGHDLACWCPLDQPCHADVLLDLANETPDCSTPTGKFLRSVELGHLRPGETVEEHVADVRGLLGGST